MAAPWRVLITGVAGFTGGYLAAHLRATTTAHLVGLDVAVPASRAPADQNDTPGLHTSPTRQRGTLGIPSLARRASVSTAFRSTSPTPIDYVPCDLADGDRLAQVVREVRPDVVFHLAALARGTPEQLQRTNVDGFVALCHALRTLRHPAGRPTRVVTVGSAAEIGAAGFAAPPVTETVSCQPETDYGRTKHEVTRLALSEPIDGPLHIVVARPFNLIGPGLSEQLALGSFARQIAAVLRREASAVSCGPLDAQRDFVDVRDAVRAYTALATGGRAGHVYNVCTGRAHRIGDLLAQMILATGADVPVVAEPASRESGPIAAFGDPAKLYRETGWKACVPLAASLTDLLRSALSSRGARGNVAA